MILLFNFDDEPFIKVHALDEWDELCSGNDNLDCVAINDTEVAVKLTHSFFKKDKSHAADNRYSKQINDIYNKLGMNAIIFDDYKN